MSFQYTINLFKDFFNRFPRHLIVAASAWVSKVIVSLVNILSIRELLLYLGEEKYAVYLIAYSIVGWSAIYQFGIGNALQNFISESKARNENYDNFMLSALQLIVILFVVLAIAIFFLSNPLQALLFRKFENPNAPIIMCVGIASLITILSAIVYNVYFARHKGYIPNILPAIASIASLVLIILFKRHSSSGSVITALFIFLLPQMLLANLLFVKVFRKFFFKLFCINIDNIKTLMTRASKFQVTFILFIIYMQTDYIIASQILSHEEIIKYGIFFRFFMFPIFIYESLLIAVWPVLSEFFIKQKYQEIKAMLRRYSFYGILTMILCSVLIYVFSGFIIRFLAPDSHIEASFGLIACFTVYSLARTITAVYGTFTNSINILRIVAVYLPFNIIINIVAQYYFGKLYGAQGIIMGNAVSLLLTSFWILPLKTRKVLQQRA
jgi:O-antigen/teichoic acid export membrane protein